jgi:tRNA(Arg) A34 adenosine deaminase TadA
VAGITTSEFIRRAAIAAANGEEAAQLHNALAELRDAVEHAEAALKAVEARELAPS